MNAPKWIGQFLLSRNIERTVDDRVEIDVEYINPKDEHARACVTVSPETLRRFRLTVTEKVLAEVKRQVDIFEKGSK